MSPEETGRWLLAIAKHLKAFVQDARLAYLYATRRSAADGELLLRLRGLRTIDRRKLEALALDIGVARQEIADTISRLEGIGLVTVARSPSTGEIVEVKESIFTEQEIFRAITTLYEATNPDPSERAMVPLIDLLSRLPLSQDEAIDRVCKMGFSEQDAIKALELQEAFGLLRQQRVSDMGITLLHNEYLWGHKIDRVGPILAKLGRGETDALLSIIEEVRVSQGKSLDQLASAPPHIVALAAKTGILDTTTIITASQDQKTFAFTPHFYGYRTGSQSVLVDDHSDQVKLFVASITYGVNHSVDFRLHSPRDFVRKLLHDGEAGNATPILRDYVLLEKHGIVTVEERSRGRGKFVLKKRDVVERALDVLVSGSLLEDGGGSNDVRTFVSQRGFRSPELNRLTAGFGQQAGNTQQFDHDLLAAVREAAQGGAW